MVKLTMGEAYDSQPGLQKLMKLSEEEKVPFKLAYSLSKIIKKIAPHLKEYEDKQRELLEKYGTEVLEEHTDENGKPVSVPSGQFKFDTPEQGEKYQEDFIFLRNTTVELDNAFPIKQEYLENVNLSVREVASLDPLLEE